MPSVFDALQVDCADFDWYVSDVESNGHQFKDGWYSGQDIKNRIESNEIQFIWGVFSAFEIGKRFEVVESPYVDGNPNYWNGSEPQTQLQGAEFEIACWDSGGVILIGLNKMLASNFIAKYSDTKPLRNDHG